MHLYCGAEGDEPDSGILRDKVQGHNQRIFQRLQLLFFATDVHDKQEDRWWRVGALKLVFHCGELWDKLSRQIGFVDICVVMRKMVASSIKGVNPNSIAEIYLAKWVQYAS
jgi:hypothetical protein